MKPLVAPEEAACNVIKCIVGNKNIIFEKEEECKMEYNDDISGSALLIFIKQTEQTNSLCVHD